jgi:hypothetical protein
MLTSRVYVGWTGNRAGAIFYSDCFFCYAIVAVSGRCTTACRLDAKLREGDVRCVTTVQHSILSAQPMYRLRNCRCQPPCSDLDRMAERVGPCGSADVADVANVTHAATFGRRDRRGGRRRKSERIDTHAHRSPDSLREMIYTLAHHSPVRNNSAHRSLMSPAFTVLHMLDAVPVIKPKRQIAVQVARPCDGLQRCRVTKMGNVSRTVR